MSGSLFPRLINLKTGGDHTNIYSYYFLSAGQRKNAGCISSSPLVFLCLEYLH